MVGSVALLRRSGRVFAVLDAGRPSGDALHVAPQRHRTNDADRQAGLECGAHSPHERRAGCHVDFVDGKGATSRNSLPHVRLSTNLALERTTTTITHATLVRRMKTATVIASVVLFALESARAANAPVPSWFPKAPRLPPAHGEVIRVATV